MSTDAPPPRFIVGVSRGGTTWMTRCLNLHPDVCAYGETAFWGRLFVQPDADGMYRRAHVDRIIAHLADNPLGPAGEGRGSLRDATVAALPGAIVDALRAQTLPAAPGAVFEACFNRTLARLEGKPAAIEKTPHHLNAVARIAGQMPGARFVVMLREPYGFMLSYKHQGAQRGETQRRMRERTYHPIAAALIWRRFMRSAEGAESDACAVVWLHEVAADPRGVVARACERFGLPFDERCVIEEADNSSFAGRARAELDPADVFWMNRIAGAAMRRHGLERRSAGWCAGGVAWSLLRLPVWAVAVALTLRGRIEGGLLRYAWRWVRGGASG